MNDDGAATVVKWPYSNPPKVGDLYSVHGKAYRIVGYEPEGLPNYDRQQVILTLEPYL